MDNESGSFIFQTDSIKRIRAARMFKKTPYGKDELNQSADNGQAKGVIVISDEK